MVDSHQWVLYPAPQRGEEMRGTRYAGGKVGLTLTLLASPKKMFHAVSKFALRGGASVTLAACGGVVHKKGCCIFKESQWRKLSAEQGGFGAGYINS